MAAALQAARRPGRLPGGVGVPGGDPAAERRGLDGCRADTEHGDATAERSAANAFAAGGRPDGGSERGRALRRRRRERALRAGAARARRRGQAVSDAAGPGSAAGARAVRGRAGPAD